MKKLRRHALAAALLGVGSGAGFAAADAPAKEVDHSGHQMGTPPSTATQVPVGGKPMPADTTATPEAAPEGAAMDHGEMNMQGGSAPPDARDPNAYSGGYSIDSGTYSLPGVPRISFGDEHTFVSVLMDRLEGVETRGGSSGGAYEGRLRIGRDYHALVIKAEGDFAKGKLEEARTEALYSRSIATYWDAQVGARYDAGKGPNRGWLAFGVQGLAPYWFEIDATAYIGEQGRTAFRLGAEYELLITQRLVVQPRIEANFYGKDDPALDIGSGLSDATAGVRLRYEFSRQFAPYVGVERASRFGRTADMLRAAGENVHETRWVAGVRFWF
ncbi:MAG: copper resistance protein B [Burkholderiaceae bacterium]